MSVIKGLIKGEGFTIDVNLITAGASCLKCVTYDEHKEIIDHESASRDDINYFDVLDNKCVSTS